MDAADPTRTALVEELLGRFPRIPPEAVVKEDLLRTGIAFEASALTDNLDGEVKPKSYFIFSFDQKPLAELGEAARRRPPEELALTGGPYRLRRTIVSVRVNPGSPYLLARDREGALKLSLEGREIADVGLPPMPEYYRHSLANGKTVMETAPTIQWGYLIYLTVLRLCQYFGAKEECGFCDINHNWRQHKQQGRPYTGARGIRVSPSVDRSLLINKLLSASPGTMAGPDLPPFRMPSRESSRRPAIMELVWQAKHCCAKTGRI
jgi:hypothetical protein